MPAFREPGEGAVVVRRDKSTAALINDERLPLVVPGMPMPLVLFAVVCSVLQLNG
ncbi:hypothetical protein GCM10018773_65400 [Streptomyces candidus]|nr:hypothetical protein GCM10018773_65400 [Streptomyces candidus]